MTLQTIDLGPEDRIAYAYTPPAAADGLTLVGFNALTGDMNGFEGALGAALREARHGTLWWDYRGQGQSPVGPDTAVGEQQIAADAVTLLTEVQPPRPLLLGLSVGGLYAARAWLAGLQAEGLVFVNTLRRDGVRLQWINRALTRMAEVGGLELLKDLYLPLLTNEAFQEANPGPYAPGADAYAPIDRSSGIYRLMKSGESVDWDLPYERLDLSVLNVTGLQDRVFYDAADVGALLQRLPDVRAVELANAGHLIPAERPQDLARELLAFADDLRSRGASA
jgi:pimeloyl-ACP methyl ester carboxylesterase